MIKQINEPEKNQANLDDWHKILCRTTMQGGGFMCIGLKNINTGEEPKLSAGSRFEMNHAFYYVEKDDEAVANTPAPKINKDNYIYASLNANGSVTLFYSDDKPEWKPDWGGWYNTDGNRALAKFFRVNNNFNGKVILDSYNAMTKINREQPFPNGTTDGIMDKDNGFGSEQHGDIFHTLKPGAYRFEIKGADGGKGGKFNNPNANTSTFGEDGAEAKPQRGFFFWDGGPIQISVGETGGNGGVPGDYGNGGGGGGGGGSRIGSIVTAEGGNHGCGGTYIGNYGAIGLDGCPAIGFKGGHGGGGTSYLSYIVRVDALPGGYERIYNSIKIQNEGKFPNENNPYTESAYVKIFRLW